MTQSFDAAIAAFAPRLPLGVALSGGADSSALLIACAERWPGQVSALHVHHGLQAAADDFVRHCTALCAHVGVPPAIAALQALSPPRQATVLRHWLAMAHAQTPSSAQLAALSAQIDACRTRGHRIHLKVGRGFVQRRGGAIDWTSGADAPES